MKKIKLNENINNPMKPQGYELNPSEEYVINMDDEFDQQSAIMASAQMMELTCIKDYHKWLLDNDIDGYNPNPSKELLSKFYGKEPLWQTEESQGLVIKDENEDSFYILMECSGSNQNFKYAQIVLTHAIKE